MSMLARRAALRALPRTRGIASTNVPINEFKQKLVDQEAHAAATSELWRKISYYVCLPAIAVCSVWVYGLETEHHRHVEHLKHENGGKLPEKPAYEYLNRRVKPFPWGNNSLFFNPAVNKDLNAVAEEE